MAGPLKQAREDDVLFPPEAAPSDAAPDLGLPAFALVVGAIAGFVLGALLAPPLARLLHHAVPERLFHALFVIGGGVAGWRVWTESLAGLAWTPPADETDAGDAEGEDDPEPAAEDPPASREAQTPAAQTPEAPTPAAQTPEVPTPEAQTPAAQTPILPPSPEGPASTGDVRGA